MDEALTPGISKQQAMTDPQPISKSRQKKLARDQRWEAGREARKTARKQRLKNKKAEIRAARAAAPQSLPISSPLAANGIVPSNEHGPRAKKSFKPKDITKTILPITFVIDCSYEHLMQQKEINSLSSQITRCYSDNHKAPFQAHLVVSSFTGKLKDRFDNVLIGHHRGWKGTRLIEDDFTIAAKQSESLMRENGGGKLEGVFRSVLPDSAVQESALAEPSAICEKHGEVVYLTSDSSHVLTSLKPYSTYIIGGLVDKNRYKGTCYKKALDKGLQTARLPIDEFMQMDGRQVLTVNHVNEIMVKWLECGDWGKAFVEVIPQRKGGKLRKDGETVTVDEQQVKLDEVQEVSQETHKGDVGQKAEREEAPLINHAEDATTAIPNDEAESPGDVTV